MEINLMTWNTELYVYGTKGKDGKIIKPFDDAPVEEVKIEVQKFMDSYENPIIVLQELPFKRKVGNRWEYNPHFEKVRKFFEENNYEFFWLDNGKEYHIKMTAVIARGGLLSDASGIEKNNMFVPVIIRDINMNILGVHAHDAFELNQWIKEHEGYFPNIIIGDFNAGNYVKTQNDYKTAVNRANFQLLSTGYIDACQGSYTRHEKGTEPTQVDHILIENSFDFNQRYKLEDVEVYDNIRLSDHYPIYCKITIK